MSDLRDLRARVSTIERSSSPPPPHTHDGADITSAVDSASKAALADGSDYAYNNSVGGTSSFAVLVGNDNGFHFGRSTSSIRYKENVRQHATDPADVLALTPVIYDRKAPEQTDTAGNVTTAPGAKDEFGLIAEQVAEHFPEIVTWYDGQIDGIRYDLLSVALLSVLKSQEARISALEAGQVSPQSVYAAHVPAPAAPALAPEPLPFEIQSTDA